MPIPKYKTTVLDAWFGRASDGWLTGVTKNLNGTVYNITDYINANWIDANGSIVVPANLTTIFNDPTLDGRSLQVGMEVAWALDTNPPTPPTVQVLRFNNQSTKVTWTPGSTSNVYDGPLFPPHKYRLRIFDAWYGLPNGGPNDNNAQMTNRVLDGTPMGEYMSKYFVFLRSADNALCIQLPKSPNDHFGDPAQGHVKTMDFWYEMTNWALGVQQHELRSETSKALIWSRSVEVCDAWYGYDTSTGLRAGVTNNGSNIAAYVEQNWGYLSDGYTIPGNFGSAFFDDAPGKAKYLAMQVLNKISDELIYLKFNKSSAAQTWSVYGNRDQRGSAPEYSGPLVPPHGVTLTISNGRYETSKDSNTTARDGTPIADYISKYFVFLAAGGQPMVTCPYAMNSHFGDPDKGTVKKLNFDAYNPMLGRTQSVSFDEHNDCGKTWSFDTGLTRNPNGVYSCSLVTDAWTARKQSCDAHMPAFSTYVQSLTNANTSQNGFQSPQKGKPTIAVLLSGGGWRAMDSAAQFFDMLKKADVNVMQLVSSVYGVSGGSWAAALSLMTGAQDRFRLAAYTDHITDPDVLPAGLVNILSAENANAAYDSVTSGSSSRADILALVMVAFPKTKVFVAGANAALFAYDQYYPAFLKAWAYDGSRTFLGNYTMLLGRQFGLITPMTAQVGVGLWQQTNAPIAFGAAVNQTRVEVGSDNWYAFDGVKLNNEPASINALGGLTQAAKYVRSDLHGAVVKAVERWWPAGDYPARTLDAAAALGICGSAPAFFSDILTPFDGEGFVGTVKTSGANGNQETPLWDAGCDINVPFPLATGYLASVGRPDICIVLDCSEDTTTAGGLLTAIKEGWYKPFNNKYDGWFTNFNMAGGEVRVYFPLAGSQYPVVIYGFGDRRTSTAKMSRTETELKVTRAIVQRTAANVKLAFDWVMRLASNQVPSTGFQAFSSPPAAEPPAPQPAVQAPRPQVDVYSLDLFGFLFADELAVWWSNPTVPPALQRDVALQHLFRGPDAANALAAGATHDAGLGRAVAAFLLEASPDGTPLRLAYSWANDLGRRIDAGDPGGDATLLDELLQRSLDDAAVPSAVAAEFRAWVVILIALRCIQTRAVLKGDDPKPARVVQFLQLLQQRGVPHAILHFTGTSATPLQDLAGMVTAGAPTKPAGAP